MRSEGARLLGSLGVTQKVIASRVGVSQATVARWISGKRDPSPEHRRILASAYRIPVAAWPDEWGAIRDLIVRKLAARAPDLLRELVEELERLGAA